MLPLEADHSILGKYRDAEDINYMRVSGIMKSWAEITPRVIRNGEVAAPITPPRNSDNDNLLPGETSFDNSSEPRSYMPVQNCLS